jgi:hypothetical protein
MLEKSDSYRTQFEAAQQQVADLLEAEAFRRALKGSDKLLAFLLRAWRPDNLPRNPFDWKEELKEDGVPTDSEHAMVRKAHGRADTPATAARSRKSGAKNGRARVAH